MKFTLKCAAVLALSAAAVFAGDLTITMMGKGKFNDGPQTHYWSAKHMRINNPGSRQDTLVDYVNGVNYTIDHKKKVVQKTSWDDLEAAVEGMAKQFKDLPPQVLAMMPGGGGGEVSVEDLGKEVVVGRTCRKWNITMGKMVIETSNDPSLKAPVPVGSYTRFLRVKNLMGAMGPAAMNMKKLGEEMAKIQGMALKTRTIMPMVGEMTTEATEVKEGAIPESVFALPSDYKVEDLGAKMAKSYRK
ncbi:MAG: DUF4412 domain-containing protein [Holophagaceae bacterium]|nr:DUF4412 domain-containing protein [Holophagaceae bacterium]